MGKRQRYRPPKLLDPFEHEQCLALIESLRLLFEEYQPLDRSAAKLSLAYASAGKAGHAAEAAIIAGVPRERIDAIVALLRR